MDYDTKKKAGQDMGELSGYINNSFSTKTGFKRYIEIANREAVFKGYSFMDKEAKIPLP